MSTRAYLARKIRVGEYECVYNHHDGDPEHLGRILKRGFRNKTAVDGLMAGGDISFIHAPTDKIDRLRNADASGVMTDMQFWNMMFYRQIDYAYIHRIGAWKAYDFAGKEIEIP